MTLEPSSQRRRKTHIVRADVVIIGGGVMGSGCAWKLAQAGRRVIVLEKSVPGAEASSAAAGILGAQAEAHGPGPMADLLHAGLARHGAWATELAKETGMDVELRPCGVLRVAESSQSLRSLRGEIAWMQSEKRPHEWLTAAGVQKLEPALAKMAGGVRFEGDARIDPKLLFRAVHVAALRAGVHFETGAYVRHIVVDGERARGVAVEGGVEYHAPTVIVAAGSWSTLIKGAKIPERAVVPARGQMVELEMPAPLTRHVVLGPRCYLVPRDDGRMLVGATIEFVGYRREVTASAVHRLLGAALRLAPSLGGATLRSSWSSFRPYTPDELPIIGRSEMPGVVLATGHYRNGILLAPITAELVRAIVLGKKTPIDLTPFEATRLKPGPKNGGSGRRPPRGVAPEGK